MESGTTQWNNSFVHSELIAFAVGKLNSFINKESMEMDYIFYQNEIK
jgi:hypothetical protein